MRRWIVVIATAYLALGLAAPILWLRSYRYCEQVAWRTRGGWQRVQTAAGNLQFDMLLADWSAVPADQLHGPRYERSVAHLPFSHFLIFSPCSSKGDVDIAWQVRDLACYARLNFGDGTCRAVLIIPFWLLALSTCPPPLILLVQRLRRRRLRA